MYCIFTPSLHLHFDKDTPMCGSQLSRVFSKRVANGCLRILSLASVIAVRISIAAHRVPPPGELPTLEVAGLLRRASSPAAKLARWSFRVLPRRARREFAQRAARRNQQIVVLMSTNFAVERNEELNNFLVSDLTKFWGPRVLSIFFFQNPHVMMTKWAVHPHRFAFLVPRYAMVLSIVIRKKMRLIVRSVLVEHRYCILSLIMLQGDVLRINCGANFDPAIK